MVCKVLTTLASGNLRWILSPSESVFDTHSVGGMPREKSSGFDTSIRSLPFRLSSPAISSASKETTPEVALTTISPWAAASLNAPSRTPWCSCCQALKGGLPYWSGSVRAIVSSGLRVPTITSCPMPSSRAAIVLPTTPVPRMPNLISSPSFRCRYHPEILQPSQYCHLVSPHVGQDRWPFDDHFLTSSSPKEWALRIRGLLRVARPATGASSA